MKNLGSKILVSIYNDIKDNKNVTELYLANKYNYSERTIRRYIKVLKNKNKIRLVGFGRKKYWQILE